MSRRHLKNCRLGIFDWNGTLKDDLWLTVESVRFIFKHFKTATPSDLGERYREEITADFKKFYYKHGVSRLVTPEEMNTQRKEFFAKHGHLAKLRQNAGKTLTICRSLGNLQLGIVSAEVTSILESNLDSFNIRGYFDQLWTEVRNKHDALVTACEYFNVKPSKAFYVDDTEEGIKAANDCGLTPVSLITPTSYTPEKLLRKAAQEHDAIVITNLFDIAQLI